MEKIDFYIRTAKEKDTIKVRYRLRDGRDVQLFHSTDIRCSKSDLSKLTPDGKTKDRVKVYNQELADSLKREYALITDAYAFICNQGLDKTSDVLEREISARRNPVEIISKDASTNIVTRFRMYADAALRAGFLGENRHKHIIVVSDKLERFLKIKGISSITAEEFDINHLMEFREFLFEEYLYVGKYPKLYEKVKDQNRPKARLSMNTVTSQLKMFQTFFTELEDIDEIRKSPFRKLGKERRKTVMKTKYDDPFFLRKEELLKIIATPAPTNLSDTREAFLVQCAFGCRISDFIAMSMSTIAVSEEGIPYVHYIPQKTADAQVGNKEVETPIVRFAFDIIKRTNFTFSVLKNVYGAYGYNNKIKALLQF